MILKNKHFSEVLINNEEKWEESDVKHTSYVMSTLIKQQYNMCKK